jgi:hypothetical protein
MAKLLVSLPDQEYEEIRKRAKSFGVSISAFVRLTIKDALPKDHDRRQAEVLKAIKAIAPTIAEAFGKTQKASPELIAKLSKVLLERHSKYCTDGE